MVLSVDRSTIRDARFLMRLPGWEGLLEEMTVQLRELRFSSFPEEQGPHRPAFTYLVERIDAPVGQVEIGELRFPLDGVHFTEFQAAEPDRQNIHLAGTAHSLGARLRVKGALLDVYSHDRGADVELNSDAWRVDHHKKRATWPATRSGQALNSSKVLTRAASRSSVV